MATFQQLIQQARDNLTVKRDQGTAFELIVKSYLQNEPAYKQRYDKVWMLSEVPEEYGISHKDTGVDLVARNRSTGTLTAVQAKFYTGRVDKGSIDSFISECGKNYYSDGLLVATTDIWSANALGAFQNLTKPIELITLKQLENAHINWQLFDFHKANTDLTKKKKKLRHYQQDAVHNAVIHYRNHDRAKMILPPGSGKTFTALKIAEALMEDRKQDEFKVLYLVPSIQLLSQTLFSWAADVSDGIEFQPFSIVSDRKATKKKTKDDESDLTASDIGFPATTDVHQFVHNYDSLSNPKGKRLITVFSTYQSIEVIHEAQEQGFPFFDLIVADEAHRTTGAKALNEPSVFTYVHDNDHVKSDLRLYQTATPRIYSETAKKKATEMSVVISSMDDEAIYGKEIYRLSFGRAVDLGVLSDYKVSVLAVSDSFINRRMQNILSSNDQLNVDDIGKIIGVWNAMVKRNGLNGAIMGPPMKRAIAFTDTIKHSKIIANEFNHVVNDYLQDVAEDSFSVKVRHADGTYNAMEKAEAISWLSDDIDNNEAHVLSNVRFLTEGIDVPNLDAVIFFSPKKSQVDIVQAVGRVMRKAPGKDYGYIILPVVINAGKDPSTVMDNDKKYKEVWQVLNALRSTDERFDAEVNKLQLNKKKSGKINFIGVNTTPGSAITEEESDTGTSAPQKDEGVQQSYLDEWRYMEKAFYGRVVEQVGNRRYLEDWSKDVADIAKRHIQRINDLIDTNTEACNAFKKYLKSLQYNINKTIDQEQAVEMLSQHLITQPVFESLFAGSNFVKENPVSKAMNEVVDVFNQYGFDREQEALKPFYDSVRLRASEIDNADAKQQIIITLYDKFFRTGFKKTTEQLGIVFTPIEVVDFIVHSVDDALRKYFDTTLAGENVHILDPFTGTGTFITRTLYYLKNMMDRGEITYADIVRKYTQELHANEIMLLSYYIAAVNIENVFDEINGPENGYLPFEGIVLTDTFESTEIGDTEIFDEVLSENNARLKKQRKQPITVITSNPPYSVGQKNANDNNQNVHYNILEEKIKNTYVKHSSSVLNTGLYDTYVKAFRWASDRLGEKGIIGFVTNGSYIDSNSTVGLRYCLNREFNHLYIYNLRGNQRTSGELSRKEGGKIFGSGSRAPIAISILIKDGSNQHEIFYHDIGDYLSREEKLKILVDTQSINHVQWDIIHPDNNNDWINQRDPNYQKYTIIGDTNHSADGIFKNNAPGIQTNRDVWVIGFNRKNVCNNVKKLIDHYNSEREKLKEDSNYHYNRDPKYIKWTRKLEKKLKDNTSINFDDKHIVLSMYRPFTKKTLYYDELLTESPGKYYDEFGENNFVIYSSGRHSTKQFSALCVNCFPDYQLSMNGQGFMRYDNEVPDIPLLDGQAKVNTDNSNINQTFADKIGLSQDDVFAYVYGVLNSTQYQGKYQNDLKKDLARIPILKQKEKYVEIGKKLMNLHLNYESVPAYPGVNIQMSDNPSYRVEKMRFGKKRDPESGKKVNNRSVIVFNDDITISEIPDKAYDYIVNGKSAIEWIMDQYQIKTDKASGITDDPNAYSDNPKYIFNLLLSIINVSVQTVDLVHQLPELEVAE